MTDETNLTPNQQDAPTEETRDIGRVILEWLAVPARVTRGWLLASVLLGFVFLGCAIYAAVQTIQLDNRVTQERVASSIAQQIVTCELTNDRRAEAKIVAEADVVEDRKLWLSIDALFDDGIPEPARTTIFSGLDSRQVKIETTYDPVDCSAIGL